MDWPKKTEREKLEIDGFIEAYAQLPESQQLEVVSKGEKPDYVVKDKQSSEEYGVELTSVYLDDRSVPDAHMKDEEGLVEIPYDKAELGKYLKRLIIAILDKVCKARRGYDCSRPLILSIYVNEYISIYLDKARMEEFVNRYEGFFDAVEPFREVVFWDLSNDDVVRVRSKVT